MYSVVMSEQIKNYRKSQNCEKLKVTAISRDRPLKYDPVIWHVNLAVYHVLALMLCTQGVFPLACFFPLKTGQNIDVSKYVYFSRRGGGWGGGEGVWETYVY